VRNYSRDYHVLTFVPTGMDARAMPAKKRRTWSKESGKEDRKRTTDMVISSRFASVEGLAVFIIGTDRWHLGRVYGPV
jgi:hypothetical protein